MYFGASAFSESVFAENPIPVFAPVFGVSGVGQLGTVVVSLNAEVFVTGVAATAVLGSTTIISGAIVYVTGVSAHARLGKQNTWSQVIDSQTSNWTPIIT